MASAGAGCQLSDPCRPSGHIAVPSLSATYFPVQTPSDSFLAPAECTACIFSLSQASLDLITSIHHPPLCRASRRFKWHRIYIHPQLVPIISHLSSWRVLRCRLNLSSLPVAANGKMPSINRKREWEGERDGARPNKKSTASASTAKPASVSNNPDPPVLIGPYDGHRRYDEWKGQMYGFPRVIPGSGAMFPTNYQINFNHSDPWECPLANCRNSFQQPSQLGAHFSVSITSHAVCSPALYYGWSTDR